MKRKLEVIAFNISCCVEIEKAGAHRIELCANPHDGGTTPSAGFIMAARKRVSIELFPIIRPRGGDFCYSKEEFEIIKTDVLFCKKNACEGIVTGLLTAAGRVDKKRMKEIVKLAQPMQVTFHRAFDRTADPFQALEDIIDTGCTRILTSGQQPLAMEGADTIKKLISQACDRMIIMPGSGIRSSNLEEIALRTGAVEFHSSARKTSDIKMHAVHGGLTGVTGHVIVDPVEVITMQLILNELEQF